MNKHIHDCIKQLLLLIKQTNTENYENINIPYDTNLSLNGLKHLHISVIKPEPEDEDRPELGPKSTFSFEDFSDEFIARANAVFVATDKASTGFNPGRIHGIIISLIKNDVWADGLFKDLCEANQLNIEEQKYFADECIKAGLFQSHFNREIAELTGQVSED